MHGLQRLLAIPQEIRAQNQISLKQAWLLLNLKQLFPTNWLRQGAARQATPGTIQRRLHRLQEQKNNPLVNIQ
jgi:hypothetical protein